jgi:hypothetical protein
MDLLAAAGERSQTVQATVREWRDEALRRELLIARGLYQDPAVVTREGGMPSRALEESEHLTRLWFRRPAEFRWESILRHDGADFGRFVGVKDREVCRTMGPDGRVDTEIYKSVADVPTIPTEILLTPAPLLELLVFNEAASTTARARPALRLRAVRRQGTRAHHLDSFAPFAEEWEVIVDIERGIVMYLAAFAQGRVLSAIEILEISFDDSLSADYFARLA